MTFAALALWLALGASCPSEAAARLRDAEARAEALDLEGALAQYRSAGAAGCDEAAETATYLEALAAARAAYALGGPVDALAPVRALAASLGARSGGAPGTLELQRLLLLAAAAAAQSEREEMRLLLDHATTMETLLVAGGQPAAPVVPAHVLAGELWLQVHRYEDARGAFELAAETTGPSLRVRLGLARALARLGDTAGACRAYAAVDGAGGTRPTVAAPAAALAQARAEAATFRRTRCEGLL